MKLLTFNWSVSIEVPDTFNSEDSGDCNTALNAAWSNVNKSDGELTDEQNIPPDRAR